MRRVLFVIVTLISILRTQVSADSFPVFLRIYDVTDYKASSQNWDLTVSKEGMLFVASNSGLLTFDGNNWTTYELPDRSVLYNVTILNDTLYTRGESTLGYWLPDQYGSYLYYPLHKTPKELSFNDQTREPSFLLPKELQNEKRSAFASVGNVHIVGTLTNGIYIINSNGEVLRHLTTQSGLHDNMVHAIYVENQENSWIAFDSGLARITLRPALRLLGKRSDIGKIVDAVMQDNLVYIKTNLGYFKRALDAGDSFIPMSDKEGQLYFSDSDLYKEYKVSNFFRKTETLDDFSVADKVYPVSDKLCWISKGNELGLFSIQDGIGFLKYRMSLSNYNMDIVYRGRRIIPLNDTLSLASTMQGVVLINTHLLTTEDVSEGLPLHITSLDYKDDTGKHALSVENTAVSLPYNFQEFTVFAGSSVFDQNTQVSYRIEGVTSDWSDWQSDGKISFLQLPQGRYQLQIRKYTSVGSFPEITLQLNVLPPWYKTLWAYLLYLTATILLLYIVIYSYIKNIRAKEQARVDEQQNAEQQKMQQLRNEMLEAELQNKKNELVIQTSALARRGAAMDTLLEELERQKEALGDRYPTKYYQQMRSLMEDTLSDKNDWTTFESYFNSANQNFIERFKQQYPDITPGDIRICCLLRMNLSTKEIASLLHISIRAIELRRYRLRKRIGLENETNLVEFLMNF